jgi:phosphoribosyl 1,2-cyclic phosphate phosphodiesterase
MRSSLFIEGEEKILIDCGPDIREQMMRFNLPLMDAVLITHEHGDHYLGLDELLSYRRCIEPELWRPIPIYATEETWKSIEPRFGYLLGNLLEKRVILPESPLQGIKTAIIPFNTYHGDFPRGSVGYTIFCGPENKQKIAYTSDFENITAGEHLLENADILVLQSNWLNEPEINRPHHMSFQRALDYLDRWRPRKTFLIHLSDQDWVEGDPANRYLKKQKPRDPLRSPSTGIPYPVPTCQEEWSALTWRIVEERNMPLDIAAAYDGLTVVVDENVGRL